jgi:hypothetical protein
MDKPTNSEEEYFAREEIEKRYKLAREVAARQKAADAAALKQAHFMKCPKCGHDLSTISFRGVDVDRCFHCHGTFLDEGELEKLAGDPSTGAASVVADITRLFRRKGD